MLSPPSLSLNHEDENSIFLQIVGKQLPRYVTSHPIRRRPILQLPKRCIKHTRIREQTMSYMNESKFSRTFRQ
jgi:hypothetical protein